MSFNILVVDDTKFMRKMLTDILKQYGYEVVGEAENGRQAVQRYEELRPDVVLMDITMPEMDGIDAMKAIRQIDSDAVVLICSAMSQQDLISDALKAGANGYVMKPFKPNRVNEIIRKYGFSRAKPAEAIIEPETTVYLPTAEAYVSEQVEVPAVEHVVEQTATIDPEPQESAFPEPAETTFVEEVAVSVETETSPEEYYKSVAEMMQDDSFEETEAVALALVDDEEEAAEPEEEHLALVADEEEAAEPEEERIALVADEDEAAEPEEERLALVADEEEAAEPEEEHLALVADEEEAAVPEEEHLALVADDEEAAEPEEEHLTLAPEVSEISEAPQLEEEHFSLDSEEEAEPQEAQRELAATMEPIQEPILEQSFTPQQHEESVLPLSILESDSAEDEADPELSLDELNALTLEMAATAQTDPPLVRADNIDTTKQQELDAAEASKKALKALDGGKIINLFRGYEPMKNFTSSYMCNWNEEVNGEMSQFLVICTEAENKIAIEVSNGSNPKTIIHLSIDGFHQLGAWLQDKLGNAPVNVRELSKRADY